MFIFAGSYERFIFGYSASADCSQPQEVVKRYTFAAHKSAVKCLVASGPYVASGGADDLIHLYNMKVERDLGVLMNPSDGAVPCLAFYTPEGRSAPSHMLSGSAEGAINIWRCKDWEHLKVMGGHKGAVNSIAVHQSGKLALSTARDCSIRMWNLAKGRLTYTAPLEAEAEEVAFLRSGESYYMLAGNRITVHSTGGEGGLLAAYNAPRRILCTSSQDDQLLLLGLEDGSVRVWDLRTSGVVGGWERAHASRVRGMAVLKEGSDKLPASLVTASSDGTIKLWDTRMLGSSCAGAGAGAGAGTAAAAARAGGANCTAQVSTGARLTCLAAVDPDARAAAVKPAAAAAAAKGAKKGRREERGEELEEEEEEAKDGREKKGSKDKGKKDAGARAQAMAAGSGGGPKEAAGREQQGKPGGKLGPQAGPRAQPQQQRPSKAKRPGQPGWGGKSGRGGGDDDPGFEVVPATPDDADAGDVKIGGGRQQGNAGPRRGLPAAAWGPGKGQGRKRRAGGSEEGEGDGEEGARGAVREFERGGAAGPSGRLQQQQGQHGQKQKGKAVGEKQMGRQEGGVKAGDGKEQQQAPRPAKKAKTAAGGSGGGGSGTGNGMARPLGVFAGLKKLGTGKAGKGKKVGRT